MSTLSQLLAREFAFVAIMGSIGSSFSLLVRRVMSMAARVSVALVIGVCVSSSIFTVLVWEFPAHSTAWLLPALAASSLIVSIALHLRRGFAVKWRSLLLTLGQMVLIAIAVIGPTSAVLAHRQSVGPVAYQVADAGGYVLETDGMIHESSRTAVSVASGGWSDLVQAFWTGYAVSDGESAIDPVSANVDALAGWGATETQSAFLLAVLLIGALGVYGLLIELLRKPSWLAVLGGALFGGSFFLQLFFDGSEGAICGLVVLLPLAFFGYEALLKPTWSSIVLLGILFSGSLTLYPPFVPPEVLAGVVALAVTTVIKVRRRDALRTYTRGLLSVLAVGSIGTLLNVYSTARDARYVANVSSYVHGQPNYDLPAHVLFSWLTQIRGLYDLSFSQHGAIWNVAVGIGLPLLLLACAIGSIARFRISLLLLTYGLLVVGLAFYNKGHVHNGALGCTYCEERTLLPLSVVIIVTVVLGLAALVARSGWLGKVTASLVATGFIACSAVAVVQSIRRFDNAYFLPTTVQSALAHLPSGENVALEGFNEAIPNPTAEFMLTYAAADERSWQHVSVPADSNENNSLLYFGNLGESSLTFPNPYFHTPVRYVLTRVPRVKTDRETLFRAGPVALQRLSHRPSVLLDSGFSVEQPAYVSASGAPLQNAWIDEPMRFVVLGPAADSSFVRLWFNLPHWLYTTAVSGPHIEQVKRAPHKISVCVRASGSSSSAALAEVHFKWGTGERLTRMAASDAGCPSA